ncbi:hypothetical protein AGMMS49983_01400 [Clostridia bacterium]|nr:hypothetical protein AGMMS49983_01400 [Clostridia bacterium]
MKKKIREPDFADLTSQGFFSSARMKRYDRAFPARLIIEKTRLYTENWSWAKNPGRITLTNVTPFPKNPLIAHFFVNIGRADALGSGIKNLYQFTKMYSGTEPELIEGDIFKIIISIQPLGSMGNNEPNKEPNAGEKRSIPTDIAEQIISVLLKNPGFTYEMIADNVGISRSSINREIKKLRESGRLQRKGNTKGEWVVLKK